MSLRKRILFHYYTWPCLIGRHDWQERPLVTFCDRCYKIMREPVEGEKQ